MNNIKDSLQTDAFNDRVNAAVRFCLQLLARRDYSQYELHGKLKHQNFDAIQIDACLLHLVKNNYQSDTRFAEMFARTRVGQRYGAKKIRYELSQKGIGDDLATAVLTQYDDQFLENTQHLIKRKISGNNLAATQTDWKLKNKITRFLVGRGYDYEMINLAFEILQSEETA